jgi:DNA-binding transcriptional ArsR family regulator
MLVRAGAGLSDTVGPVFAALADPTRRSVVESLLRDGTTSVPALTAELPISRQAIAKHHATHGEAGLVERAPTPGREIRYRLRDGGLDPAASWMRATETAWDDRLTRLKATLEA